ncbi:hypothetical protein ACGFZQ_14785 [Streptomyces sp. NPDC048254]|uniref:hypothetical protein n=1 Tax=Streptomyces sp. NPDC048254 TaxID=3365525 RepID=UPI00370FB25B
MRTANPTTIGELWRSGKAPAWDGLYRADGSARSARVDGGELSWFELGEPLDLDALLAASPDHVAQVGASPDRIAALQDGSGYVGRGEGALGADGFFARFDILSNRFCRRLPGHVHQQPGQVVHGGSGGPGLRALRRERATLLGGPQSSRSSLPRGSSKPRLYEAEMDWETAVAESLAPGLDVVRPSLTDSDREVRSMAAALVGDASVEWTGRARACLVGAEAAVALTLGSPAARLPGRVKQWLRDPEAAVRFRVARTARTAPAAEDARLVVLAVGVYDTDRGAVETVWPAEALGRCRPRTHPAGRHRHRRRRGRPLDTAGEAFVTFAGRTGEVSAWCR